MVLKRSETALAPPRQGQTTPTTVDELRRLVADDLEVGWRCFDEAYRTDLTNFAFRIVRDRDRAHDITQATFQRWFRAVNESAELESQTPIQGWLRLTCKRIIIDEARQPSCIQLAEGEAGSTNGPVHHQHEMRILFRIDYRACRGKLTSRERLVLQRIRDGWTVRELAAETGWTRGTVGRLALASKRQVIDCLLSQSWTEQEIRGALA